MTSIEALTPEHFAQVASWLSQHDINRWLTSDWRGRTVDPTFIAIAVRNKRNRLFLVRCDGDPCGVVALADWDPLDRVAMIWYALGKPLIGRRGIISEAVQHLVELSFTQLGIESLYAWIIEDNAPSRRVLEKTGFDEVGRMRNAVRRGGDQLDRVYFDKAKVARFG